MQSKKEYKRACRSSSFYSENNIHQYFMLKHKENQPRDNKTYQYPNQPHKTEKAITSNTHCLHTKIKMSSPPCAFSKQFQRKAN